MSDHPQPYRIYCYDAARTMVSSDWLHGSSDDEAITKARSADFGSKCEIWHGRRLVAQLGEDQQSAA